MNNFFKSCRRCLSTKIVILIIAVVIALLIFIPKLGVVSLVAALPLVGCTVMCGAMAFMMRGNKQKDK